jgi:hypothetical protein
MLSIVPGQRIAVENATSVGPQIDAAIDPRIAGNHHLGTVGDRTDKAPVIEQKTRMRNKPGPALAFSGVRNEISRRTGAPRRVLRLVAFF